MRKSLTMLVSLLAIAALGTAAVADSPRGLPHRYAPRSMDGRIHQVDVPANHTTIATWSYRSGSQFDIAVSSADANGRWTEPVFFGRDDNRDQVDPVVAADSAGNVYLAYTDRDQGRVMLSTRPAGRTDWSTPLAVTPLDSGAETPGLLVTGDRLVVAFQIDRQIQLIEIPISVGQSGLLGLTDDSDPVGHEDDGPPPEGDNTSGEGDLSRDFSPIDKKIRPPQR